MRKQNKFEGVELRKLILINFFKETAHSAFKHQLEKLPKLLPNYQIISYDPAGLGKSRPPARRKFFDNVHVRDAENLVKFFDLMNLKKFSLLGW